MMRSGNPALKSDTFTPFRDKRLSKDNLSLTGFTKVRNASSGNTMSIQGTVNKTFILLFFTVFSASWVWDKPNFFLPFLWPALIIGMIVAFVTIFKKDWAPITAPIYALIEGLALGVISALIERSHPGIVMQAVGLTFSVLFSLLIAYKSKIIKVTDNFRLGVVAATGGIGLLYIVSMIMGAFGTRIPFIHESGPLGIGFSLFVIVIASFNLVLDFDFIEKGAKSGAPKYMEWYGAFGLIVTLVWLYLEMLRLLSKLQSRR